MVVIVMLELPSMIASYGYIAPSKLECGGNMSRMYDDTAPRKEAVV
jgi:hypothetical protein